MYTKCISLTYLFAFSSYFCMHIHKCILILACWLGKGCVFRCSQFITANRMSFFSTAIRIWINRIALATADLRQYSQLINKTKTIISIFFPFISYGIADLLIVCISIAAVAPIYVCVRMGSLNNNTQSLNLSLFYGFIQNFFLLFSSFAVVFLCVAGTVDSVI